MRKPQEQSRGSAGGLAVRGDSLLGRALAARRVLSTVSPEYLALLDKLEASTGLDPLFEKAFAGLDSNEIDEAACNLIHDIVISAIAVSMAPDLPARREASEKEFKKLFDAVKVLGRYFGVRSFPKVPVPVVESGLDGVDVDKELRQAVEVRRAALENSQPDFEDERSLAQIAAFRYDSEEAPAALLRIWERISILRGATFGSLSAPSLGRNQIKDAESRLFVQQLGRSMGSLPAGAHLGFITAVTNVLFDLEGDGGISDDAIRKRLKSTRLKGRSGR